MNGQSNSTIAQNCTNIIEQLILHAQQKCSNMVNGQSWIFADQVTIPILQVVNQMKSIICQLENQMLLGSRFQEGNVKQHCKERKDVLSQVTSTKLQPQLECNNQLLNQYKYKAQIYYQHWLSEMGQINQKNLQIATLKNEKDKLSKQMSANFELYKRQVELNSQLSRQCSINYAAYLKQSEARKTQCQNNHFKQSELQQIQQLKVEICALNKIVTQFSEQSSTIERAYKQLQRENKDLQQEIINLKKYIKYLVQPNQLSKPLMTQVIAELYQKLIRAETQVREQYNEEKNESSENMHQLKKQIRKMTLDYAEIYLINKQNEYNTTFQRSLRCETPISNNNFELFQYTKGSLKSGTNTTSPHSRKITEETNLSKSATNENRGQLQFFSQEGLLQETATIKQLIWKFQSDQEWKSIFAKTAELLCKEIKNKNILYISTLCGLKDRKTSIKIYYQNKLLPDSTPKTKIKYSMIKTKLQSYTTAQKPEHQRQVSDQLMWLCRRKVRIVSINDLQIDLNQDEILTVVWYQKLNQ